MTLVIAVVWGKGVLVTSDSRASSGYVYHEERKIYPVYFYLNGEELDLAVLAGSGDSAIVKQGFQIANNVFRNWFEEVGKVEERNPNEDEMDKIVNEIERRLMRRYRELRSYGVEPSSSMLLASVTQEGNPILYKFDNRGIAEPMHENPGYALLGKGVITGGLLLLRLLDYRTEEDWDMGTLSAFLIDTVSEVDPSVSPFLGESVYIRYENNRVRMGPLKDEAFKEFKEKVRMRREAIKLLWRVLEKIGEEEVLKVLNGMLKGE